MTGPRYSSAIDNERCARFAPSALSFDSHRAFNAKHALVWLSSHVHLAREREPRAGQFIIGIKERAIAISACY